MSAGSSKLALVDDQIFGPNGLAREVAFENLARAGRIASLGRERAARDVRRHAVVGHGPPWMVLCRRLWKPNVTRIAGELAALQSPHDCVAIDDLGPSGIHDVAASLHHADQLVVEHVLGFRM